MMTLSPTQSDVSAMHRQVRDWQRQGLTVGVVPTMGALHKGHLSLVEAARRECQRVVTTIFVNPLQFGPGEDFSKYPRSLDHDVELLAGAGCDVVFAPSEAALYPPGCEMSVAVGRVAVPWEGAARPIHFRGVATVVLKLLNIVPAEFAYFGQKDYQQTVVVRRMVEDFNIQTVIRVCPTVRESDGLAMSSRNVYLSPDERKSALLLSQSLHEAELRLDAGETKASEIIAVIRQRFATDFGIELDYVAVLRDGTVDAVEAIEGPVVIALAARVGQTRLIDNVRVG